MQIYKDTVFLNEKIMRSNQDIAKLRQLHFWRGRGQGIIGGITGGKEEIWGAGKLLTLLCIL